jgi:hypothetical protein
MRIGNSSFQAKGMLFKLFHINGLTGYV